MNASALMQSMTSSVSSYQRAVSADGTLVIIVCKAKHLPNRRKLDKQSPYVTLCLGTTAKKTPCHFRAGQTPEWTHEVRFQLTRDRKPIIRLDVLDETKNDPTPIGTCEIDCTIIFDDENQSDGKYIYDKWYDLTLNGRRAGMIYLESTFYPSAPVLPPKLYDTMNYSQLQDTTKTLPPPPPQHPSKSRKPSVVDDVFVDGDYKPKSRFFNFSSDTDPSLGSSCSSVEPDQEPDSKNFKQKYYAKFNKFTKKFQTKEPITHLWNPEVKAQNEHLNNIVPINTTEFDNLEELARDIQPRPYNMAINENTDDLEIPPKPPTHSVHSHHASYEKPLASPTKSPIRKPPPEFQPHTPKRTTATPFSADTIGIDEDEPHLPTDVYCMHQQVKSLSYASLALPPSPINIDELDPKYYAPTPNEHYKHHKQPNEKRSIDYRTTETGYLGNGKWDNKFSPSVFDRIPLNDENLGFENKPHVPPKIPQGLSEMEYYVLERDNYLKDINGQRV